VATIPVGPHPGAIIIVPTASVTELFVALDGGNAVAVIDADARRVLRTIQVGTQPVSLSLAGTNSGIADPNDPEVYVACAGSRSVAVIETAQNQVVAHLQLSASPTAVVVPATGGAAYVTSVAGTIEAISVANHSYLGVVYQRSGARFGTMDYDAITGQIYVPDAASGDVDVLAPISVSGEGGAIAFPHEPARVVRASGAPSAVAITFDGSYGFVARREAGSVVMLDPASHQELATIAVGGAPAALVTGPYPPAVSGATAFLIDVAVIALLIAFMGFAVVSAARSARRRKTGQSPPPA
jgi:YVTN family beta-propeller protein